MKSSIGALGLGVVALTAPPTAIAAPIPEFHAFYRNVDEAAAGSADVSLSYDSVSRVYTLTDKRVDATARELVRTLRFNLVDDRVRPLSYRQQDRRCGSCTFTVRFDWGGGRLEYDSGGAQHRGSLSETNGSPSLVVRDVAMLTAQLPGRQELVGFDDVLAAAPLGTVELMTAVGQVHAEGRALHGRTQAAMWFAPELEHLPVRIQLFGMTLELTQLDGIDLSATPSTLAGAEGALASPLLSDEAAAPIPEYRAVYRIDHKKTVGGGRLEIAVTHDRASDSYELVATAIEIKHPERVLVMKMPFRLVSDRVQPLELHIEDRGRPAFTAAIEFDWALHEIIGRFDGREQRFPLVAFEDRDEQGQPIAVLEPLAGLIAFLPGSREIAGFDDVLASESLGAADVSLPIGSVAVERVVLRGMLKDTSLEVWGALDFGDLPVRVTGPAMVRKATTFELTELHGIERAAPSASGAP